MLVAGTMLRGIRKSRHEQVVVARGTLDKVAGILRKQDLLDFYLDGKLAPTGDDTASSTTLVDAFMRVIDQRESQAPAV